MYLTLYLVSNLAICKMYFNLFMFLDLYLTTVDNSNGAKMYVSMCITSFFANIPIEASGEKITNGKFCWELSMEDFYRIIKGKVQEIYLFINISSEDRLKITNWTFLSEFRMIYILHYTASSPGAYPIHMYISKASVISNTMFTIESNLANPFISLSNVPSSYYVTNFLKLMY